MNYIDWSRERSRKIKVVIFGATGQTGKHLVEQTLNAEHEVTAFVRDVSRLIPESDQLRVIEGDVHDANRVDRAITGQDAVMSALGQNPNRPSTKGLLTVASQHIVESMKKP